MTEEIDEYYDIDIEEIPEDERLPKLIRTWANTFGEISKHNEYASILAYFNLLGQILKDDLVVPYGYTMEDSRVHVCWIQTARSGKSVLNDFYSQLAQKTFDHIDAHEQREQGSYFTVFDIVDTTDAGLVGSTDKVPNPDFGEPGEPREIDIQVDGGLAGHGIALFDEFEASGIFKKYAHKEKVVTYFQKLMNTMTTDGYLIKKKLAHGPVITCDCQRSVWGTSYVPEYLTEVIATKGVLQRMFLYVRDVPQHILDKMRRELIQSIGTIKDRAQPSNRFSLALYKIYLEVKERRNEGVAKENMVTFADGVTDTIDIEYDNMIKYMGKLPDEVRKVVSLFETNSLIYLTKMAALCAITESPGRAENEKWVVYPRNVRQAAWVVRQGYMSMVAWTISALRVSRTSVAEMVGIDDYTNAYHNCNDKEGWVNKAELRIKCDERYNIPQAKFYRAWPKISHKFDSKKIGKTNYVKLKEVEE